MAVLVHPQSELIREPRLLVPGQKPVGPVRVDMSSTFGQRLIWMALLNDRAGFVGIATKPLALGSTAKYGHNGKSRVAESISNNSTNVCFVDPSPGPVLAKIPLLFTVCFRCMVSAYTAYGAIWQFSNDANTQIFGVRASASGTESVWIIAGGLGAFDGGTPIAMSEFATAANWAFVDQEGGTSTRRVLYYKDGVERSAGNRGAIFPWTTTAGEYFQLFDDRKLGLNRGATGWVEYISVFAGVMTPAELVAYQSDPYQFLIPA